MITPDNVQLPVEGASQADSERQAASEVERKFTSWRAERNPYEIQWFQNAALVRGIHWAIWNERQGKLTVPKAPPHRIRLVINRVLSKFKARQAKFLRNRWEPTVVPASQERRDRQDARMTQQTLQYLLVKEGVERKYRSLLNWSNVAGKSFMWLYWDPTKLARVKQKDALGQETVTEVPLGDICLEAGSPFEILVPDTGLPSLSEQSEFMRVKLRRVDDMKQRYQDKAHLIKADTANRDTFQFQRQIASLAVRGSSGLGLLNSTGRADRELENQFVIVKELFVRPNGQYPQGRHAVVAGGVLLKDEPALPYGFSDMANPYPVVEFPDVESVGQFWPTTYVEQLGSLQREYNFIRSKVAEQFRAMAHPKILVPSQAQFPKEAWNSEAGEIIRYHALPGLPPPTIVQPPNIASDAWRILELLKTEFDEVTNVYPASQGNTSGANSGFQVNLLQEATDSVHAPDIRLHELALEEACYKIRRMMKQGYDVPRLVSIAGKNSIPDAFEFSQNNIDEHAEIRIYSGSVLSNSPAMRTKQLLELGGAGWLGNPQDPNDRSKFLSLLELNGNAGEMREEEKVDEDLAYSENQAMSQGAMDVPVTRGHNHQRHWALHWMFTKTPEFTQLQPNQQREFYKHLTRHGKYINLQDAFVMAMEMGLQELMPELQAYQMLVAPPQMLPQAPPEGGPQGPPPGPVQ